MVTDGGRYVSHSWWVVWYLVIHDLVIKTFAEIYTHVDGSIEYTETSLSELVECTLPEWQRPPPISCIMRALCNHECKISIQNRFADTPLRPPHRRYSRARACTGGENPAVTSHMAHVNAQ